MVYIVIALSTIFLQEFFPNPITRPMHYLVAFIFVHRNNNIIF